MTEREIKTITTPCGHTVIIHTYLTGREQAAIDNAITAAMKMKPSMKKGEEPVISEMSGAFLADIEQKTLSFMLVSIDGTTEKAVDMLLDLPATEYAFVKAEIETLTNPTKPGNSAQHGSGISEPAA